MIYLKCFIFCFILLYLVEVAKAARPQIVDKIIPEIKPAKSTAFLNCTVALMDTKDSNVEWWLIKKDPQHITAGITIIPVNRLGPGGVLKWQAIKTTGRDVSIPDMGANTLTTFTLIIRFLERDDSGDYRCQIRMPGESDFATWPHASGKLIVQSQPQINPTTTSNNQVVDENDDVTLTCIAEGFPEPKISWTRTNGLPLPLPGSPQRFIGQNLVLKNVTRQARGVYRCFGQNNVGTAAEYDISLDVNYAPETLPARVDGMYGQAPDRNFEATLECIVSGYPDPEVTWYKGVWSKDVTLEKKEDGPYSEVEKMFSQGAAGIPVTSVFYILKLWNIKNNDYGKYTCRAQNKYGATQTIITLFETRQCQGAVCPLLDKIGSIVGTANSIHANNFLLCWLAVVLFLTHYVLLKQ